MIHKIQKVLEKLNEEDLKSVYDFACSQPSVSSDFPKKNDTTNYIKYRTLCLLSEELSKQTFDDLFEEAARLSVEQGHSTISLLQRKLGIGFSRGAKIIDQLEHAGIVGPDNGLKPRKILMTKEQLEHYLKD